MATSKILCGYCEHWISGKRTSQLEEEEDTSKKKKGKKKRKKKGNGGLLIRRCPVNSKEVSTLDIGCRYLKPKGFFFCDEYAYLVSFKGCINRRKSMEVDPKCRCNTCRQYWREVDPIIEGFEIVPKKRIIKRRSKVGRVIKRRPKKRVIKRRKKEVRKIKRRKKSQPNHKVCLWCMTPEIPYYLSNLKEPCELCGKEDTGIYRPDEYMEANRKKPKKIRRR